MKRLALLCLLAGCAGPPALETEPPPHEAPVIPACAEETTCEQTGGCLTGGLTAAQVEERCGKPYSKLYNATFPNVVAWRYCGTPCRKSQMYVIAFSDGKSMVWSGGYEVVQAP